MNGRYPVIVRYARDLRLYPVGTRYGDPSPGLRPETPLGSRTIAVLSRDIRLRTAILVPHGRYREYPSWDDGVRKTGRSPRAIPVRITAP